MKVSREQAAENRERIIEVAGRLFRERGFDGIGVADLMKAAGLTHGGFYGHFKSKEDLIAQASARAHAGTCEAWSQTADRLGGEAFAVLASQYLSVAHRDNPGMGCAFAALGSEAGRQGEAVRSVFSQGLEGFVGVLSRILPGRSAAARRRKALAAMAQMVGALAIARAVDDEALSKEILAAAREDLGIEPAVN
ncbi:TetR family transcriptional regulator [Bosea caraganae]|uniref:TetR family transcriptional regulator n=1 Tax=Bosea caraganae TaxID=2763117 RepID=A0A370L504_9HYPH|nr:TetR family transcriptional regulator [Bosea caraganae]RDJ24101.1 TetR family transcriptional regulator [Bosea caraganae]RDJ30143.1 TetR family transcriptional regulator [Bosea caraganae]